jgi:hypothetical protein
MYELITLAFAAWIAVLVLCARHRVSVYSATRNDPAHRALAIRTSIFGLVLFIALL